MAVDSIGVQLVPSITPEDTRVTPVGERRLGLTESVWGNLGYTWQDLSHWIRTFNSNVLGSGLYPASIAFGNDDLTPHSAGYDMPHGHHNEPLYEVPSGKVIADGRDLPCAQILYKPTAAKVARLDTSPAILQKVIWDNSLGNAPLHCEAEISTEIRQVAECNWHSDHEVSESVTIGLEVGSEAAGVKSSFESTTTYGFSWGQGGSESKETNAGSSASIQRDVPAGQIEIAGLIANRGTLVIEVDLDWQILGYVGAQYWRKGHHHYITGGYPHAWYNLADIMKYNHLSTTGTASATITYDFYADDKVGAYPIASSAPEDIKTALVAALKT
ncbi:MAG: hypothetical protein OXE95_11055 [Chloroflexi bacterium]|nr:hypothetical protein [Chloroflexota bacterium]